MELFMPRREALDQKLSVAEVKRRSIRGVTLLVIREACIKLVAILGQLWLVHLLAPQQFGVIAVFSFIMNVGNLFTDVGFVAGVIRAPQRPSQAVLSTLFYIKLGLTAIVVLLLLVSAPIFPHLFISLQGADARILMVLALTLLTRPLQTLLYSLLERELRYDAIPIVDVGGLLVYFSVAVCLAAWGWGVWSLVWSIVAQSLVSILILEYLIPWKPSGSFSWKEVRPYIHFGAPLQGNLIVSFLQQSIIPLVGGAMLNARFVGLLDWSFNIASLSRALTDNVSRVSYSSYSRLQNEKIVLEKAISQTVQMLALFIQLLLLGSLFFGKRILLLVIGSRWVEAAPIVTILLAGELFYIAVSIIQQALTVRGKTKELVSLSTGTFLVQLISSFVLVRWVGFSGIAWGILLGWVVQSIFIWRLLDKIDLAISGRALVPTLLVGLGALIVGWLVNVFPTDNVVVLLLQISLFVLGYGVLTLLVARDTVNQAHKLFFNHFGKQKE